MLKKPKQVILTAGPKVTSRDVTYVTDAVRHGWNFHHSDYIYKFEEAFAKYVGAKYALTMPTGTSAMHLGLVLFGIGPTDEVIVPDFTYIACANVIHYTGAKPVLVEVDSATWSIDVTKVERYITKRTRAIMPVHLYGNAADMPAILKIAKKYNLFVLEDACEGLGCTLGEKVLGAWGDIGAFSFQGAKLLAIGEGGMFVTNRKDWIERARSLVDHGISTIRQFWHNEIGFMYPMNNISAALGLARLEDLADLIDRKRRIFSWYKERLGDIEGLSMNPERRELFSSYWMSSIILERNFDISRDELRKKLKEKCIDTRPFFFPISEFGLYTKKQLRQKHPVSYHLSHNGINLPSGVMLDEETVDYVAQTIRELLHV